MRVHADTDAPVEGERKTVTALFADIKGSTELEQDLDPEDARAIVDPALKLMIDAVQRYDGYIVQSTGDGIFALFGAPVAHEDHPQRALYAALRMQDEVRRYADRLRAEGRAPLQIRVGANTGEVVVRSIVTGAQKSEYTPIGHTANLASRMQTLANPGSTVISEHTRRLVDGYFELKPLGPARIRGVSEAVNVYEVAGLGPLRTRLQRSAGRGLTKFIGREREMAAMVHAAGLAKSGHGQIVAAVAEAGVGKSRLFHEFKARNQAGWMVLEAFSVSHGKASAYLPVIDLLHAYFRIESDDDPRTRREKVAGRLSILDPTLEDARPYLFALLALLEGDDPLAQMDAQIRRRRTHDAIKRVLLRESLNQPLMVIFEDLHWIDDETQALLNLLADSLATSRILMLVNYRPEYSHQWGSKTCYTQLRLDPLGKASAAEMLDALLGASVGSRAPSSPTPLPDQGEDARAARARVRVSDDLEALKRLIIDKTDGNPFFMEEMVQALFEDGALVREQSLAGTKAPVVRLTRRLDELKIPPTVQGILMSRIDRLPSDEKELLQTLAVLGKEFPLGLTRRVTARPDDDLNRMLSDLQLAEFIYEQPAMGDVEYTFKHALTQEVAYNSVLLERRKATHERIGAAIEALYADSLDDHVEQLAHHYRRSPNAAKAVDYLIRAGEKAMARNAPNEAVAGLREGLALLGGIVDESERERREAALQLALAEALSFSTGGPATAPAEQAYLRARELCERYGDRDGLFTARLGLRMVYTFRAELGRALELSEELLKMGPDLDPSRQLNARVSAAQTLYFLGELDAARRHLEQVRRAAAAVPQSDASQTPQRRLMVAEPRSRLALILALLGYPEQAAREDREGRAFARQTQLPNAIGLAEFFSAQRHFFMREASKVREHSELANRLANQHGMLQLSGYVGAFLGWADAMQGDAGGIEQIQQAMKVVADVGSRIHSLQDALLIECYLKHGRLDEGLVLASEALAHAQRTGERYCMPELSRLRGELLTLKGDREAAEAAFRTAIEVARGQQARWWELRATVSLARLLAKQGKRDEARAMLAPIYGWFTEGFDTADLSDARALLAELNG